MIKSTSPFFSIVIPVYNMQVYLSRCIESCINQSFDDIEILIVDDHSEDDSIKIAQDYANRDSRIQILKNQKNLGLFHTRIQGFKNAKGAFTLSLDADDFLDLKICEILAHILQKDQKIDMLHFNFKKIPSKFYIPHSLHPPHKGYLYQEDIKYFINLSNTFHTMWSKAIKTSFLHSLCNQTSFIKPPLNTLEDGVFNLLLSFQIQVYFGIDVVGYFYQKNPNSITRLVSEETFKKKCQDFSKVLDALNEIKKEYPNEEIIILEYQKKILSAFFLEARFFDNSKLIEIYNILSDKQIKNVSPPPQILHINLLGILYDINEIIFSMANTCKITNQYFYIWKN